VETSSTRLPRRYLGGGEHCRDKKSRPSANPAVICRGIDGPSGYRVETWPEIYAHESPGNIDAKEPEPKAYMLLIIDNERPLSEWITAAQP